MHNVFDIMLLVLYISALAFTGFRVLRGLLRFRAKYGTIDPIALIRENQQAELDVLTAMRASEAVMRVAKKEQFYSMLAGSIIGAIVVAAGIALGLVLIGCSGESSQETRLDKNGNECGTCAATLYEPSPAPICEESEPLYQAVIDCVCSGNCAADCNHEDDVCDTDTDPSEQCKSCLIRPDFLGGCNTTIYECQFE